MLVPVEKRSFSTGTRERHIGHENIALREHRPLRGKITSNESPQERA